MDHFDDVIWLKLRSKQYTVESRYNAAQYTMLSHAAMQWQQQNINQNSNSPKAPHTSPLRVIYGVSVAEISEKMDCVITTPHCITHKSQRKTCRILWNEYCACWWPGTDRCDDILNVYHTRPCAYQLFQGCACKVCETHRLKVKWQKRTG